MKKKIDTKMSIKIDPREVLEHLEYLGYRSITKDQLRDFIRDLKRLIKYEQCQEKRNEFDTHQKVGERVSIACETSFSFTGVERPLIDYSDNVGRGSLYNNDNDISCSEKESEDNRSAYLINADKSTDRSYHPNDYIEKENDDNVYKNHSCDCCKKLNEQSTAKSSHRKCCAGLEKPAQPIPSFIRPGTGKPMKNDPVALYHYYQSQWSKRPLPGEDPRTDLRWAIRTRLAQQQQQQQQVLQRRSAFSDGCQKRKFQI